MATHLIQRTLVHCSSAQSARRLSDVFREFGNAAGDTAKFSLVLDLNVPGRRAVVVTLQTHYIKGDMEPRYGAQWASAEPGPFPLFAGELRCEGDESYNLFNLVLDGFYEPPLGLIGAGFDAIVGTRIAAICARNLLSTIAEHIENAFAIDEAAKASLAEAKGRAEFAEAS